MIKSLERNLDKTSLMVIFHTVLWLPLLLLYIPMLLLQVLLWYAGFSHPHCHHSEAIVCDKVIDVGKGLPCLLLLDLKGAGADTGGK